MEKIENTSTNVALNTSAGVKSQQQSVSNVSGAVKSESQTVPDVSAKVISEPQAVFNVSGVVTSQPPTINKGKGVVSKAPLIQLLNNSGSISLNTRMALGFALPPILPLKELGILGTGFMGIKKKVKESPLKGTGVLGATTFQAPVTLKLALEKETGGFKLPVDPVISISGRNVITRRYVAKSKIRGSIKELWSQDDYDISISGVLVEDEGKSLNDYLLKLQEYCNANESIHVDCDILNSGLGITHMTIESYDFPFTKGTEYQSFTIKGYSDDSYQLLEK